jgi:hypothetical protein
MDCQITVTFTPTATGNRTGTITIADSSSGSPQTVTLSGMGTDFSIVTATRQFYFRGRYGRSARDV